MNNRHPHGYAIRPKSPIEFLSMDTFDGVQIQCGFQIANVFLGIAAFVRHFVSVNLNICLIDSVSIRHPHGRPVRPDAQGISIITVERERLGRIGGSVRHIKSVNLPSPGCIQDRSIRPKPLKFPSSFIKCDVFVGIAGFGSSLMVSENLRNILFFIFFIEAFEIAFICHPHGFAIRPDSPRQRVRGG